MLMIVVVIAWSWLVAVGILGLVLGFLLLDEVGAGEMDLAVNVIGDHVIPIRETVIEFLDMLLAGGDLLVVFLLLPLVVFLDPLALGLQVDFLLVFLGLVLLRRVLLARIGIRFALSVPGFVPSAFVAGFLSQSFLVILRL